jgi:hypothetical protein
MSYVLCAPIASPGDSQGSGEPFRAVNDNHDIANRRVPVTSDPDFRRSVFGGHRSIFPLPRKGLSLPQAHLKSEAARMVPVGFIRPGRSKART